MPNNELDDFIDEIDDTIEANTLEKPLAKGVATQHGINQRPRALPLFLFKAICPTCGFSIRHEFQHIGDCQAYIDEAIDHCERYRHEVAYTYISLINGSSSESYFSPSKPVWRDRIESFYDSVGFAVFCLFCICFGIFSAIHVSGRVYWFLVGCVAWQCFCLAKWGKERWKRKGD